MYFRVPYHVENGGDGSANVQFHPTFEEAEKADAAQDEGWGESSAGILHLKVEDGKAYYKDYVPVDPNDPDGKHDLLWVEIKETP